MKNGLEIDSKGNKSWWKDDVLHREDGPAVEWVNGYKSWWLNGIKVDKITVSKIKPFKGRHRCKGYPEICEKRSWIKIGNSLCEECKNKKIFESSHNQTIDVSKAVGYAKKKRKLKFMKKEIDFKELVKKELVQKVNKIFIF